MSILEGTFADVEQNVFQVPKFKKRERLMQLLDAECTVGTIVFVEKKFIASQSTQPYHFMVISRNKHERRPRFTGIPNVRHVINYDLPKRADDYVHRINRAGRVDNRGRATSFFNAVDLLHILETQHQVVPAFLREAGAQQNASQEEEW